MLEAFVGPCPPGEECCHGPGGPADNRLANLRWDTRQANIRDAVLGGKHVGSRTHCPRGHELATPNLLPGCLRKGYRSCWACSRAHGEAATRRRRGEYVEDTYATADWYYARIMGQ